MDALQAIKSRRSIRAYKPTPVSREVLIDLVDCARLAPTAMNVQLWKFVVVTDKRTIAQIGALISHAAFLPTVPALIAVLSADHKYYVEDCSAATENILLAAQAHGLGSCWVSGDKQPYADDVRKLLGADQSMRLFSVVALGYAAESPAPEKRTLNQVLHWEKM